MIPELVGVTTQRPMVLSTQGSVGQAGQNREDDTRLVQSLLNRIPARSGGPQAPLKVDGLVGPKSIEAIRRFQMANFGSADGRVDARNQTIRRLIVTAMAASPTAAPPRLTPPAAGEIESITAVTGRQSLFAKVPSIPQSPGAAPVRALVGSPGSALVGGATTGFGAPFTRSGFTINNNAFSFDISVKDTGAYVARLEIFRDDAPTQRQKVLILGGFKAVSPKGLLPFGADISLPSFNSTQGTILRGLLGFAPLSIQSFFGVCQFGSIGGSLGPGGGALNFFQFGVGIGLPPGSCIGLAVMAGEQKGIPGVSIGGGTGVCVPG